MHLNDSSTAGGGCCEKTRSPASGGPGRVAPTFYAASSPSTEPMARPRGSSPEGGPARARGSRGEAAPPSEPYLRDDAGKVRRSALRDGRVAWLREGRAFRVVSFSVFQIALRLIPRTPRPRARCPPAERRSVKFVQQRSCKLPARVEGNLRISSRKTAYPCTTAGDVKRGHRAGADVGGRRCRMAAAEELGLNPTGQSRPS
jgi:hypothetical protein